MKRIRQLNKANAWEGFKKSYPQAMEEFCKWIDEYKIKSEYFKVIASYLDEQEKKAVSYKFHELPGEFQYGIFVCYIFNLLNEQKLPTTGVSLQIGLAPKENEMEWYIIAQKVLEAREKFIESVDYVKSRIITKPSGLIGLDGKPIK